MWGASRSGRAARVTSSKPVPSLHTVRNRSASLSYAAMRSAPYVPARFPRPANAPTITRSIVSFRAALYSFLNLIHWYPRAPASYVESSAFALDNRTSLANPRPQPVNDLGELSRRVLEMTREELDSLRGDVRLYSQAIVLVFEGRLPHAREDLLERLEALREHCPNRTE